MTTSAAAASFASAALGAVIGGVITFLVSLRTLREAHRLERVSRRSDEQRAAARRVAAALVHAAGSLPAVVGERDSEAAAALLSLDTALASDLPLLDEASVAARLLAARDLLDWDPVEAAALYGWGTGQQARLSARVAVDRSTYVRWVVKGLQDVAAGRPARDDLPAPAGLDQHDALPWTPSTARASRT